MVHVPVTSVNASSVVDRIVESTVVGVTAVSVGVTVASVESGASGEVAWPEVWLLPQLVQMAGVPLDPWVLRSASEVVPRDPAVDPVPGPPEEADSVVPCGEPEDTVDPGAPVGPGVDSPDSDVAPPGPGLVGVSSSGVVICPGDVLHAGITLVVGLIVVSEVQTRGRRVSRSRSAAHGRGGVPVLSTTGTVAVLRAVLVPSGKS